MSNDDFSIVPERDEIRARTDQRNKPKPRQDNTSKATQNKAKPAKTSGTGGASQAIVWMLAVLVVCLSGAVTYLYLDGQKARENSAFMEERIADIESKLSVTDESLSQSGAAIQAVLKDQRGELDLHMSEIRKLWGVSYDRNRVAIEKLDKLAKSSSEKIAQSAKTLTELKPLVSGQEEIQTRLDTLTSQLLAQSLSLDELSGSSRQLIDARDAMTRELASASSKIKEFEEAIDAFDEYRLQINQRLRSLERAPAPSAQADINPTSAQ